MVNCKECKKKVSSGIWIESQFKDNPLLIFCSEKCKKDYILRKINRIKTGYPSYYKKITADFNKKKDVFIDFFQYMEKQVI